MRILLRAPNWTGDFVMSTPGFRALRAGMPGAHIALHVRSGLEPLAAGAPWFDEVIPVRSYHLGLSAIVREASALRASRFDLGICLPDSFSSALLMRLAGVHRILGYRGRWRSPLLHRPVALPEGRLAAAGARRLIARERLVLGLVAACGCAPQGTKLELFKTPEEEQRAGELLRACGVGGKQALAVLAPGASFGPSKLWPAASFARVGDALARAGNAVAVVGAPREAALCAEVGALMCEPFANLAGQLDLGILKAVLARANVLVCNDAGARHVAVAFGVPSIVLMGPTSLAKTNMNLEDVRVVETAAACRPCYLRECPIDHRCLREIAPERVTGLALQLITRPADSTSQEHP